MISASVAPFGRPISARIFAPLLSGRGVPALPGSRFAGLLAVLARFVGAAALVLPALAAFRPLGVSFCWLGPF